MEALNLYLFSLINATPQSPHWLLGLANVLAVYAIFLVPVVLVIGWLRRDEARHRLMLAALIACGVALAINGVIGLLWFHPRPFVMPVGHTFLHHSADASFPSDHMTIAMTVALSLLMARETRAMGAIMFAIALAVGWSRIYLGVHFPIDMIGGALVALFGASVAHLTKRLYIRPLYRLLRGFHRRLFAVLIRRGWMSR
ncbi:phosphatase PAP2 family protein [Carnimonas bestiolae]|uniref:phosphatase PAP2 family protein n=1 Tax=Carnimonas bestiolae TaxID=3402172 RepID=UPI003EDCA17F